MKKVKFILISIYCAFVSIISPIWIGFIYMDITGHGKGYAYDMGSEADIAVLFGVIQLVLWIIALFPALIWICRKLSQHKKPFVFIPIIGFGILSCLGIVLLGWNEFIKLFGFGYSF